jgi:hypothetical protein
LVEFGGQGGGIWAEVLLLTGFPMLGFSPSSLLAHVYYMMYCVDVYLNWIDAMRVVE